MGTTLFGGRTNISSGTATRVKPKPVNPEIKLDNKIALKLTTKMIKVLVMALKIIVVGNLLLQSQEVAWHLESRSIGLLVSQRIICDQESHNVDSSFSYLVEF
jgi:hypothetical protein